MTDNDTTRYHPSTSMTGRASRARKLSPAFLVVATAIACGSSHNGKEGEDPSDGDGGSGGTSTGVSGFGANPPQVGTGGATAPGTSGTGPTTGGFATAGTFGVAGTATGGFATGGFGATGGGPIAGGASGAGGSVSYPPGSCPAQPPPNGTSCAAYHADPGFHCYYDAPACRVVSTCLASDKWLSGCEAPGTGGDAGAPGDAGAGGI